MSALSARLDARVRRDFPPDRVVSVLNRLEALELPSAENQSLERVQAAIVLAAAGDEGRLEQAFAQAETDWRDILVAADLADENWRERLDDEFGARV